MSLNSQAMRLALTSLTLICTIHSASAGNIYDVVSGSLVIPVIRVSEDLTVMGQFQQTSANPPIWGSDEFPVVSASSRTDAVYSDASGSILVPEINVADELYTLSFKVTSGCGFTVCIEADPASLVANGRYGAAVFTTPLSNASTFSCSSCHAMSETDGFASDGFRRPGHPLMNASKRESYKNGQFDSFLDAVNTCVTEWMNGDALSETDPDWVNLLNWLEDQNTDAAAELVQIEIVEPLADLSGGNAIAGRELFNTYCIVCHGFDGEGTQLAPKITGFNLTADYIGLRTRTSGLTGSDTYTGLTGGIMPFWGANRLSNSDLVDIVAFVSDGADSDIEMGNDDPLINSETGCSALDSRVGQTAELSMLFHQVSGTATIVDDCTIDITGFSFDGGGIDVRFYVGSDGRFRESQGGFAISEDLVGIAYADNTLRLTLPPGKTLDDFNSISVWCVAVGVSFGTGFFS